MRYLNRVHVTCKWNAQTKLTDFTFLSLNFDINGNRILYYGKQTNSIMCLFDNVLTFLS